MSGTLEGLKPNMRGKIGIHEVEDRLHHVKLAEASVTGLRLEPLPFSPQTSSLLSGSLVQDDHEEAVMRQCFHEAFARELEYLKSLNVDVSKERQRQILADILVWAEITQNHYAPEQRSFVMEPHQHDESFLRVGRFLMEAKEQHGMM